MAPRRKALAKKPTNGARVTTRDLLDAVTSLGGRIDDLHTRDDAAVERHQQLSKKMDDLREVTNERLYAMETDITMIKRPLALVTSGWSKAMALSGGVGAISVLITRLELWHFVPGL